MAPTATNDSTPVTNDTGTAAASKYPGIDLSSFTQGCQNVAGPKADARTKYLADTFMKHLHAWALETDLTLEEWLKGCESLVKAGQISSDKRNEFILISDILGLESLLDTMTHERAEQVAAAKGERVKTKATESAVLGPFYREGAPEYSMGADIVMDHSILSKDGKKGQTCTFSGTVTGTDGKPIEGAEIDVWHTGPNGFYEQQDPKAPEWNCRGKFRTGADGKYSLRCLRPTAYPIPFDSTAGDLLRALDRSAMRPAHIHFLIKKDGYKTLITQIYDRTCEFVDKDAVFGTKDSLVIDFKPATSSGVQTELEVDYDISLVPVSA